MKKSFVRKKRGILKTVIISLFSFILLFSLVSIIVVKNVYDGFFPRSEKPEYNMYLTYDDKTEYIRNTVNFKSGDNLLTGYIYGSENDKGLIVIAHGLGGGAESYIQETAFFVDNGWRVFSYDCTGSYASEGDGTKGLAQSVLDLDAALTYIENNSSLNSLPVMLYGHSWGGFAVTAVLNYEHDVTSVVSVAGFNSPTEMLIEWAMNMLGFFTYFEYPFLWGYQTFLFGDAAGLTGTDGINKANIPVMIVHGKNDTVIKHDGAAIISHKDNIKNPNAIFYTYDEEYHDGHNNIFMSDEAVIYNRDTMNERYNDLPAMYENGEIPEGALKDFYANIDREKMSGLNEKFIADVNTFFNDSLNK